PWRRPRPGFEPSWLAKLPRSFLIFATNRRAISSNPKPGRHRRAQADLTHEFNRRAKHMNGELVASIVSFEEDEAMVVFAFSANDECRLAALPVTGPDPDESTHRRGKRADGAHDQRHVEGRQQRTPGGGEHDAKQSGGNQSATARHRAVEARGDAGVAGVDRG